MSFQKVSTIDDDIDFNAMQERAERLLSDSDILTPIEHQIKDRAKQQNFINPAHSKLLFELLDNEQSPPEKMEYDETSLKDEWAYHPRLGDLEKREIIFLNDKTGNKRKEILWFAKEECEMRKVFVDFSVERISSIDNILETFRMRFVVSLNWIMTEREYRKYTKSKASKYYFEPLWHPNLNFLNAVELHRMRWFEWPQFGKYKIFTFGDFFVDNEHDYVQPNEFDPALCRFIGCKLECDVTFAEELELQSFPFDVQDLSVSIKGESINKQKFIFLPQLRRPIFGSIDPRYSVLDEWDLTTALIEFSDEAMITLRVKVERKWTVYVVNIISLLCALCFLSLCAFFLPREQLGERLSMIITLILTCVAFSIVIQDKLPNVAYLTFIDKYILASYFFLICVMIESVLVSTIDDEEWQLETDAFLFWIFFVFWLFFMAFLFIFYAFKLRQREKEKLFFCSDEVNEYNEASEHCLEFDLRNWQRTGHKKQILSFMAHTKLNENRSKWSEKEKVKSENLRRRYIQHLKQQNNEY